MRVPERVADLEQEPNRVLNREPGLPRNPLAQGRAIPLGGPEALTWLDIVERAAAIVGRVIPVRHVPPGSPIPGLPDTVAQIAAGLDRYETVLDSQPLAEELGIELTTVESWLRQRLAD